MDQDKPKTDLDEEKKTTSSEKTEGLEKSEAKPAAGDGAVESAPKADEAKKDAAKAADKAADKADDKAGEKAEAKSESKEEPKPKPKVKTATAKQGEKVINLYQANKRIHPKRSSGKYSKLRVLAILATQFVFFILPWFNWDGRQMVLFDISHRLFYIFGLVLTPGDLIFLSGILFLSAFGLFWWTTVAGRLWCGYACPQTVYTEVFMWMDYYIEGDRAQRMKLEKSKWNENKKWQKKSLKYTLIFLFSAWVGLTFIGWFSPIREVFHDFVTLNLSFTQWFAAIFYGFLTFFFGHIMREQVCKYMCPYARFQSAMFDEDTLIISYDAERGEPRGAKKKNQDNSHLGDCVNCTLCVQVCPTGIDIRNGLQYECIGCAACIDVCNDVMDKVGSPRGLIRYTTEAALEHKYDEKHIPKRILRPRALGYGVVLLIVLTAWIVGIFTRELVKADLVKDHGVISRENREGLIENSYTLRLINSSDKDMEVDLSVSGIKDIKITGIPGNRVYVPAGATVSKPLQLTAPPENLDEPKNGIPASHKIQMTFGYTPLDPEEAKDFKHRQDVTRETGTYDLKFNERKFKGERREFTDKAVFIGVR